MVRCWLLQKSKFCPVNYRIDVASCQILMTDIIQRGRLRSWDVVRFTHQFDPLVIPACIHVFGSEAAPRPNILGSTANRTHKLSSSRLDELLIIINGILLLLTQSLMQRWVSAADKALFVAGWASSESGMLALMPSLSLSHSPPTLCLYTQFTPFLSF